MIKYVICDDDEVLLQELKRIIDKIMMNNNIPYVIHLYNNYTKEFMKEITDDNSTKVYILDTETPTASGFDVASKIREVDLYSDIIFFAENEKHVINAIKMDLLFTSFISKFENIEERFRNVLEKTVLNNKGKNRVNVATKSAIYQFNIMDILYVYKDNYTRKTVIHTTNNEVEISKPLYSLMEKLDDRFVQSHRSCYVNLYKIQKVDLCENMIIFDSKNETNLLSSYYKKDLSEFIG